MNTPTDSILSKSTFVLRGFASTTDVMGAAHACRAAEVACRLVPRPGALGGAECGTALRTEPSDDERVEEVLRAAGISAQGCVTVLDYE